jgi:outer membrane receptor protein involved in Fe transport
VEYTQVLRNFVWLLAAVSLFGQSEIRLQVTDSAGVPMAAAGVINARRFQTGPSGDLTLSGLTPGPYQLTLFKPGFATQSRNIELADRPLTLTVALAPAATTTAIDVIDATPLAGIGVSAVEVPAPVQTVSAGDFDATNALDLSDLLNRRLRGVFLNEVQGNPVQPDLNYRGYTASPLLGTPQGLSIYMDGVRLNQPFGDVVSWDLIPRIAIAETTLMPAANPLFGLNTLGGALSIHTKSGATHPGTALQLSGGGFGRKMGDFEHGGAAQNGLNWFLAGSLFFEDGWRESSPSNVRQLFSRIGYQRGNTALNLAFGYANNLLNGNGMQEFRLLARDYRSVYTKPDITANRAPFFNFSASHNISSRLTFTGNVYYRHFRTRTYNGDINEEALDQSLYQPNAEERSALTNAGFSGFPVSGEGPANTPFPSWRCLAQSLLNDEPAEKCNGLINTSRTTQHNYGASGQLTWFTRNHQFTGGAAFDRSSVDFSQLTQLGFLNPDRSITGVNSFADGVTGGFEDDVPYDTRVLLAGDLRTASLYATDKLTIGRAWNLTLSGRYNHTRIDNRDRIRPAPGTGSLTGLHHFQRFNPAAGLTYSPSARWNFYASYSEANRAPTSIELGCADPESPCKLPNAMAGDPPLRQVVTRGFEGGVRGSTEARWNWSAGFFRSGNWNDILFVASEQTGYGYFRNFGRTRRQGAEFDLNGRFGRVSMGASYTYLQATYQSPETVNGEANSSNDEALQGEKGFEGLIAIRAGNRIPLVPSHLTKAHAALQLTKRLTVNLGVVGISGSFARGNENNLHAPDGTYYLGPGRSPGYGVANLGARYQLHSRAEFFVQVNNLFNRQYYSAAQLGPAGFTPAGSFLARPLPAVDGEYPVQSTTFFAPGAPRGAWAGVKIRF